MHTRRLLLLAIVASGSACANVLGLDFVDTEPSTGSGGPTTNTGDARTAADAASDSPSDDVSDGGEEDGHLDSAASDGAAQTGDGASGDGASGDGGAVIAINPCPDAGGIVTVSFPVPSDSICYTATSDVTGDAAGAEVGSNMSGAFSGVTLNLPQANFAAPGMVCVMDMKIGDAGPPVHGDRLTLVSVGTTGVDIIADMNNELGAGKSPDEVVDSLGPFAAAESGLTVGFLISVGGGNQAKLTPYSSKAGLSDAGETIVTLSGGNLPIRFGIDSYTHGSFLTISSIHCTPHD